MTPIEWAAFGAALASILNILGEHTPGVLIGLVVAWAYWQREKVIAAERKECQTCKEAHAKDYRELIDRLMTLVDNANAGLNAVNVNMASLSRNTQVSEKLDDLAARVRGAEVKNNVNAKARSGQAGRKTD